MASEPFRGSKKAAEGNTVTFPADVNDLTDEDESADVFEIPVNVEIITDEEDVDEEIEDSPPLKKLKISDTNSFSVGNVALDNIENLKNKMKGKSARECFEEFFTDEVFQTIVRETERYAGNVKNKHNFKITITDVKILLGFMIFAGYHRLPCERDYWSDDEDLGIPLVKAAMTRNAFAELKSCLHFQDNSSARENTTDRSFKIRPLMDVLNRNFQKWDVFHEYLSVGEIMIPCYGMNKAKQKKSVRMGYKLGVLCGDGYCYKFWLYSGQQDGDSQLIKDSPDLESKYLDALLQNDFLQNIRLHSELKNDTNQPVNKKCVGGVKYYELLLRKHSIPIKGKKWYWCLITRMIDIAIVNAFHVFRETQETHKCKCVKDFRREIAVPYLKLGHCRRMARSLAPNPSRTHVNEDVRFDGLNHIIGKREKQRRCQFQTCKGRPKTYCVKCNITLCTTCFPQFHFR